MIFPIFEVYLWHYYREVCVYFFHTQTYVDESILCRAWETFLIILVIYSAWVSPFEFGFLEAPRGALSIADNVVNGFFAIDIILTFFVAYLDRRTYLLVDSPKQIAWRYSRTWLALDVASTIPSEAARHLLPPKLRSYGFFNMLRLWRLRRVSSLFAG